MFCATRDRYFAMFNINKFYCIADQVTPGAGICTHQQCIFFSLLHLVYQFYFGIGNNVSFLVKILIIEWNKFKENIIIKNKLHSFCMFSCFITDKSFA